MNKNIKKQFSTFYPMYGNKNPNIRYFVTINGIKKELKYLNDNIYYYCIDRIRHFVKIEGGMYKKNFVEIKEANGEKFIDILDNNYNIIKSTIYNQETAEEVIEIIKKEL